jgi:hypothetical protein
MTLYTSRLPLPVCLHLWDVIIAKGIWAIAEINVVLL